MHIKFLLREQKLQMFVLVFSQAATRNQRTDVLPSILIATTSSKEKQLKSWNFPFSFSYGNKQKYSCSLPQ